HGPDLAVAEEAAERHVARDRLEDARVVVGLAVEMLAAPEAREQQCARGARARAPAGRALQRREQIVGARLPVAHVKPDLPADRQLLADRDHAVLGVDAEEIADEVVAGLGRLLLERVHRDAAEDRRARELALFVAERVDLPLDEFERLLAVDLHEVMALRLRDAARLPDRLASLRDDRVDDERARERDRDRARAMRRAVEIEAVLPGRARPARESA